MAFHYDEKIYNKQSAREVVPLVLDLLQPASVIDVGCGLGTWLAVFEELGVKDILGIDGSDTASEQLEIPKEKFIPADLTQPLQISRRFDLVVCLEVAEHLPGTAAEAFIGTLTSLGDTILFSAAIPGQGGQEHINEQWPEYWQEKFLKHNYKFYDLIRERIWGNDKVEWWYRQNTFLVSKKDFGQNHKNKVTPYVHPELLKLKVAQLNQLEKLQRRIEDFEQGKVGVQIGFDVLKKAVQRKIK